MYSIDLNGGLYFALPGVVEYRRRFDGTREAAILKVLLVTQSAADHPNLCRGAGAFNRHLICHLPIEIAAAIQGERRPFHGQVHRDFTSQHHQKRSVLQPLLAVPHVGLEPQDPHPLRDT